MRYSVTVVSNYEQIVEIEVDADSPNHAAEIVEAHDDDILVHPGVVYVGSIEWTDDSVPHASKVD